jgi:hypothetical protein
MSPPSLSRSSTYAKTIPLHDKVVHVVRSPTEGVKLKDVQWVIQGTEEHVLTHPNSRRLIIVAVFARVGPDAGLEEGVDATKVSRCGG